jgi:dTDP-4-dehydrorhamnose 3,5-epimerase
VSGADHVADFLSSVMTRERFPLPCQSKINLKINHMIQGVEVKELKVIKDSRGFLMEMLRADDKIFHKFGQVYMTFCKYGVAKAWHYHKLQDDHFIALQGKTLVGLYDARKSSRTYGQTAKFILAAPDFAKASSGKAQQIVLKIPKGVYHGFAALTKNGSKVLNVPTKTYNYKKPDEYRAPWNDKNIPFNWPKLVQRGG